MSIKELLENADDEQIYLFKVFHFKEPGFYYKKSPSVYYSKRFYS